MNCAQNFIRKSILALRGLRLGFKDFGFVVKKLHSNLGTSQHVCSSYACDEKYSKARGLFKALLL